MRHEFGQGAGRSSDRRLGRSLVGLVATIAAACLTAALVAPTVASAGVAVTFPDANLEAAVRAALAIPVGPITSSNMASLTVLSAPSSGITRLDGLEYATNLSTLQLGQNDITTITPLAGLTKLSVVGLPANHIEDISPLTNDTALAWLNIGNNEISSVTPLQNRTALQYLDLDNNNITSIAPLAGLTNLSFLALYHNDISDISAVSGLHLLTTLWVGQNSSLTSIGPVAGVTSLKDLDVGYDPISDITPVAGLTNLTSLDLYADGNVVDLAPIAGLTKLEWLNIAQNEVYDISALKNLNGATKRQIIIERNWLDLTPGSPSSAIVNGLAGKGYVVVVALGQRSGAAITGSVKAASGAALGGATIALAAGPRATSKTNGSYLIGLAKPGDRIITFSKPYYHSKTVTFTASEGVTSTINATLAPVQLALAVKCSPSSTSLTYRRKHGVVKFSFSAVFSDARGLVKGATVYLQKRKPGGSWTNAYKLVTSSSGKASHTFSAKSSSTTYYRWYSPSNSWDKAKTTASQKVVVK